MNYLLINHSPFALTGKPAEVRAAPALAADFAAQAAALREVGLRLLVAAPVVPARHPAAARCTSDPFAPDDLGFELLHLPIYQSLRAYLRIKRALNDALRAHLATADVVQMGYGGHPMMLGEIAWPLAIGHKRVWMFDAIDPFTQMHKSARADALLRRVAKDRLTAHKIKFCREAIRQADLVFAHHPSIADRFAAAWGPHCHEMDAPLFGESDLVSERGLLDRAKRTADKKRAIRFATFAPRNPADPADHLVRALAHCRRLSVPVELLIIGTSAAAEPMLRLADELAMGEFVQRELRPGEWPALMKLLDTCDATLSAASAGIDELETFGSFARGLPAVGYENPATVRLIETADAGLIVPTGNVLLLAQAMLDLHRTPRLTARLSENARQAAQKRTREFIHRRRAEIVAASVGSELERVR